MFSDNCSAAGPADASAQALTSEIEKGLPPVKQSHSISGPSKLSHATTARLRLSDSFRDVGKLLASVDGQEDVGQRAVEFECLARDSEC